MKITIKDIAKELDLNFSSVSRALNNKPGVSEETRRIVMETAEKLGYRPNVIARGLVSRVTRTIGVIVPDIINPIFGEITTAIIDTANENGYDVFLCISNWSNKKEEDYIHTVQQKQVDGIIIKSVSDSNTGLLERSSVPVIGYESWTTNNKFSSVSVDNVRGGYMAAEHLIQYGYLKTAIISGPANSSASINRRKGFNDAFEDHNLKTDGSRMYIGEYNIESGYTLAKQLFQDFPDTDSVFAGNDVMALGVLQYLEEHGLAPGKDVGVIGFDDIQISHLPQFMLTTIKQPKFGIGKIMTNVLLEEVNNHNKDRQNFPQRIMLDPELIVRETTKLQPPQMNTRQL